MPSALLTLTSAGTACFTGRCNSSQKLKRAVPRPLSRHEFRSFGLSVWRRIRAVANAALIGAALALSGIWPPALRAQTTPHEAFWTGNDLYEACGRARSPACLAYVAGVTDGWSLLEATMVSTGQVDKKRWCSPKGASTGQMRDVVGQYLERNPQNRHFSAASLTLEALAQAFPCPQAK